MAVYLANRIKGGALEYTTVVTKRPDLKADIDAELIRLDYEHLII